MKTVRQIKIRFSILACLVCCGNGKWPIINLQGNFFLGHAHFLLTVYQIRIVIYKAPNPRIFWWYFAYPQINNAYFWLKYKECEIDCFFNRIVRPNIYVFFGQKKQMRPPKIYFVFYVPKIEVGQKIIKQNAELGLGAW